MRLSLILDTLERRFPRALAQSWDNVGLLLGNPVADVKSVLVALDLTAEVLREAKRRKATLIVVHHPVLFAPVKRLRDDDPQERLVCEAIRAGMHVYAVHTSADSASGGINDALAAKLGIVDPKPLRVAEIGGCFKLVTFVTDEHVARVRNALSAAGAGVIGEYEACSFTLHGTGTFRPSKKAKPLFGKAGALEEAREARLEMVVPEAKLRAVLDALRASHPYDEVAFDCYPLRQFGLEQGIGRFGKLAKPAPLGALIQRYKKALGVKNMRVCGGNDRRIRTVAVVGGSGGDFIRDAMSRKIDLFVSSELKHHHGLLAEAGGMALMDVDHYASEKIMTDIVASALREDLPLLHVYASRGGGSPFAWR